MANQRAQDHRIAERARDIFVVSANSILQAGASAQETVLGMIVATNDLATQLSGGDRVAAIEWQRTCLDLQERQLLAKVPLYAKL